MKKHTLLVLGLVYISILTLLESQGLVNQSISSQIPTVCLFLLYGYNLYLASREVPDIRAEILEEIKKRDEHLQQLKNEVGKVSLSVTRSGAFNEKVRF